mgnify:CR=1 FL=1
MKARTDSFKVVLISSLVLAFFLVISFSAFSLFSSAKEYRTLTGEQNFAVTDSEMNKMELPSYYTIFRFFITKIPFKADKN